MWGFMLGQLFVELNRHLKNIYIYIYMGDSESLAFNDGEFKEAGHCYP